MIIKLLLSELIHKNNYSLNKDKVLSSLRKNGYYFLPDFMKPAEIKEALNDFNKAYFENKKNITLESNGSDRRIYGIERKTNFTNDLLIDYSTLVNRKFSFSSNNNFILSGWIKSSENNTGSGNGWHRDSPFRHQFKSILYLVDVNKNNGPFEYIPESHTFKNLLKISKHSGQTNSEFRFNHSTIKSLTQKKILKKSKVFTSKAGSLILVDTRGLHRGRPLIEGERKALTTYFLSKEKEKKFL